MSLEDKFQHLKGKGRFIAWKVTPNADSGGVNAGNNLLIGVALGVLIAILIVQMVSLG